jgi:hypothetical protein
LPAPLETEPYGGAAEFLGPGVRHSQWRWYLPGAATLRVSFAVRHL